MHSGLQNEGEYRRTLQRVPPFMSVEKQMLISWESRLCVERSSPPAIKLKGCLFCSCYAPIQMYSALKDGRKVSRSAGSGAIRRRSCCRRNNLLDLVALVELHVWSQEILVLQEGIGRRHLVR